MTDSDDTTTLLSVTRRKLLTGATAVTAAWPLRNGPAAAAGTLSADPAFDPALVLWREWKAASLDTEAACRKQQGLETKLVNTIGFPQAKVHLPDEDVTIPVTWHGEIEEFFGDDPAFSEIRAKAETDLAAHQARWDEEDRRIGYSAAKLAELEAADREQDLVDTLMATPAVTLSGVAGKLDAVLSEGESCEDCMDFPWPQVRSALADLVRIGHKTDPGSSMPGSDRDSPYPRNHREAVYPSVTMYQQGDRVV